jgi:hypothetical protein
VKLSFFKKLSTELHKYAAGKDWKKQGGQSLRTSVCLCPINQALPTLPLSEKGGYDETKDYFFDVCLLFSVFHAFTVCPC